MAKMSRSLAIAAATVAAVIVLAWIPGSTTADNAGKASTAKAVAWPADQIQFKPVIPGVTKAVLWGDPDKGAYGTLTRFAAGTKNALHTHSHDIKIVVISGTFVLGTETGEKQLGPGSYALEPAGMKHTSGAAPGADCLFFEESDGKFDMKMLEGGASAAK